MLKLYLHQQMELVGKVAILVAIGVQLVSISDVQAAKTSAEIDVQQAAARVTITDTPMIMLDNRLQSLETEARILGWNRESEKALGISTDSSQISGHLEIFEAEVSALEEHVKNAENKSSEANRNYNSAIDKYRELRSAQSWGSAIFPWLFLIGSILVLSARFLELKKESTDEAA